MSRPLLQVAEGARVGSGEQSGMHGAAPRNSIRFRRITAGSEHAYVPQTMVELPEDQANEVLKLVDALEQDEDVQHVFHNLA